MPNFPRHSSQRQMTTQQPEPLRREAAAQAAVATEAMGAVQKMAITIDNAMVTAQTNAFKANKGVFLTDLKNRAGLEPDQNALGRYQKELADYQKNALNDMSPRARQQSQLELQSDIQLSQIWLEGTFFKKQAAEAVKNLAVSVETNLNNALMASTPDEMQKKISEAVQQINENVSVGFITQDEGKRQIEKLEEDLRLGIIDRDLYSDPKGFKNNLSAYTFKSEKEKSDKLETANKLIEKEKKEIEKAIKISTDAEENGLTEMRVNMADVNGNPVTAIDLIRLAKKKMNDKQITPKFANTYIKSLESITDSKPSKLENLKVYNTLKNKQVALRDKEFWWKEASFEDRAKYRADVLGAYNNGNITETQMKSLMSGASDKFMKDPNVRNAVKQVTAQASLYDSPEAKAEAEAEMHFDLINRIIDGQDPNIALQDVVRERTMADIGKVSNKDEFGFEIGDERRGYIYQGNNQWQKKQ